MEYFSPPPYKESLKVLKGFQMEPVYFELPKAPSVDIAKVREYFGPKGYPDAKAKLELMASIYNSPVIADDIDDHSFRRAAQAAIIAAHPGLKDELRKLFDNNALSLGAQKINKDSHNILLSQCQQTIRHPLSGYFIEAVHNLSSYTPEGPLGINQRGYPLSIYDGFPGQKLEIARIHLETIHSTLSHFS